MNGVIDKGASGDQEVIAEALEAEYRIRKDKRQQRKREQPRFSEIQKREKYVTDQIGIIENGEHRYRIDTGSEHERCGDQTDHGGGNPQNQVDTLTKRIVILGIDTGEIRQLRAAKEDHPGDAELNGDKNEEKVRAHRSEQSEQGKEP